MTLSGYIQDDLIGVEQGGRNDTDDKGMQDEHQLVSGWSTILLKLNIAAPRMEDFWHVLRSSERVISDILRSHQDTESLFDEHQDADGTACC